ncbi:MAG: penicillin-binding protein 1A [Thiolinea sp.]
MRFFINLMTYLLSSFLSLGTVGLAILAGLYFIYSPQLPDSEDLRKIDIQVPLRIYSRDERLIAEYGEKRSRPVNFDEIPERLRQAFIAIEDARYYEHQGIDPKGVARAMYNVVSTGRKSQGASTITMQLARNAFLDNDKTFARKFKETLLAIRLEQTLSKDEILEMYLNKIFLGNRSYGIAAAAETYYGKQLDDLSLAQMAMIAGLPKAPSRYNPIVNEPRAMIRRNYILQRMAELGFISQAEFQVAVKEPNTASVHKTDIETYAPYLAEMVRAAIVEKYQEKAYTQGYDVYTTLDSQAQIYATDALRKTLEDYDRRHGYRGAEDHINLEDFPSQDELLDKLSTYQQVGDLHAGLVLKSSKHEASVLLMNESIITLQLEDVKWATKFVSANRRGGTPKRVSDAIVAGDIIRVRQQVTPNQQTEGGEDNSLNHQAPKVTTNSNWQLTQVPTVGGALVLMDPHNGAIRAVMGGYDFYHSKFNRATQAMRQPGSSFKPIIYSAALSRGFAPTSIVNDAPITIPGSNWQPKNFGGSYIGPTTLSEALAKSRNLVSIRLLRDTGIPYTINYATRFGFSKDNLPPNLTLSLGTGVTTPVQMATAYSAFANGGFKVDAHFINRIQDSNGQVLFDATTETRQVCGDDIKLCPIRKPKKTDKKLAERPELEETETKNDSDSKQATIATEATAEELEVLDYETEPGKVAPAAQRIIDSRTQYQIVGMMQGVTQFGTAAAVSRTLQRKDIAGKTGTTSDQRDSWFCGFTPNYVAVAWSGFDDMAELGEGETSGKVAVPMWISFMQKILKDVPEKKYKKLEKLQLVKVDAKTGLLADDTSLEVIEEKLVAQPEAAKPETEQAKTESFEFTSATNEQQQPQATARQTTNPPAAAPRKREVVEIPEQIF